MPRKKQEPKDPTPQPVHILMVMNKVYETNDAVFYEHRVEKPNDEFDYFTPIGLKKRKIETKKGHFAPETLLIEVKTSGCDCSFCTSDNTYFAEQRKLRDKARNENGGKLKAPRGEVNDGGQDPDTQKETEQKADESSLQGISQDDVR